MCVCCTSIVAKGTRLQLYKYMNVSNNHSETSWIKQLVSHSQPFCFYRLFIAIGMQVMPSSNSRVRICSSFTVHVRWYTPKQLFLKQAPKMAFGQMVIIK